MNSDQLCVVCIGDGNLSNRKDTVSVSGKESAILAVTHACEAINAKIQHYTFDQVSKSNTEVLDALYNAEILVIDVSGWKEISVVLYHLGVRESVKSTVNIVLVSADDVDLLRSLPSFEEPNVLLPYVKDEKGCARYVDPSRLDLLNGEMGNVKAKIMGNLSTLSTRLKDSFMNAQKDTGYHLTCQFVKELRIDRETLKVEDLREKLCKMRRRLDDPRLLSSDSLLNMFLSYKHVEAYSEMISLVEAIQGLQNYQHLLDPPNIRYHYAFALNRRNSEGDREKALSIIKDVIENCKQPWPDLYGLEGRIYKDRFVESNCTDREALEKATESYRKGFQESSSDYLGVNLATLLVIGGADRSNKELATICNMLWINAGRKGNLQDLQDYWNVATFFEVSVLWADYAGAAKAAKCMHKLNPPSWHLDSTLRNIQLILRARKIKADTRCKDVEVFNFWLEFFQECIQNPGELWVSAEKTQEKSSGSTKGDGETENDKKKLITKSEETQEAEVPQRILFPVLLVDMNDEELKPAHLHLHVHSDKPNMRVCYVEGDQQPQVKTSTHRAVTSVVVTLAEQGDTENDNSTAVPNFLFNQTFDLVFYDDDIKGFGLNPKDKRNLYFFTAQAEDYSIFFPCESSRTEFLAAIRALLSESDNYLVDEHVDDEPIQFVYETDESGDPIVLGSGSFGTVYAGRELIREVKIAIKEIKNIPQKDLQPLIEEINLQSRLNHTNIVCYLGSVYEDGVLKILMEHVPGGSLSFLLKKIGGLRDETVSHYSSQILEGLRYLHASKIVHRDIKGDNILVNMYRGELKIADFGASKRLGGLIRKAGTVTGTMRFMAPELINASKDGYGYPADIWSFGCTVVEMVTGKLPYHELDAFAAFYLAGYYSTHPDIPEELPELCKAFIKRCFEIDPDKRASADKLLTDPFILMYKRHKGRSQPKGPASSRPSEVTALPTPLVVNAPQKPYSETEGEKRRIPALNRIPLPKANGIGPSHSRTYSSTACKTAPILQDSMREISPLTVSELPIYGNSPATAPRRPEQCHSRQRASYGGTSAVTDIYCLNEDAFRSPLFDVIKDGGIITTPKVSIASPISNGIPSPDNFNVIKSMDEAKKQLSSALMQSKASVLNWWIKQIISTARLPKTPLLSSYSPSVDLDNVSTSSPKISSLTPSEVILRDEHDLIECMFDFLIDALNGGDSLQSLNRLLRSTIRSTSINQVPNVGNHPRRLYTSFSFDEVQPACELTFVAVVSRILQKQRLIMQQSEGSGSGSPESIIQQIVAFIEKAWYVVSRTLPGPLRDIGQCQQKPHKMLTWIKLIGDIAGEAIDQLSLEAGSALIRRTKTIGGGQRLGGTSSHREALRGPKLSTSSLPNRSKATSSGFRLPPRVRVISPNLAQSPTTPESYVPTSQPSPAYSQLTDADSDEDRFILTCPNPKPSSDGDPIGCRTKLRRNVHPVRYIKRAAMSLSGSPFRSKKRHQNTAETTEWSDLNRINMQILEELNEVTRNYNQLLRGELKRKEEYVAALERLSTHSLNLNGAFAPHIPCVSGQFPNFAGISSGFPSLSKWLGELGIPMVDIEKLTAHQFDQNDFLELITKDDLWKLELMGGSVLRIWSAVSTLRNNFLSNQANKFDQPNLP